MDLEPSDQKRHIRQALADLIFGLTLFAIFILLGVFGAQQAGSHVSMPVESGGIVSAPSPNQQYNGALRHLGLPLGDET